MRVRTDAELAMAVREIYAEGTPRSMIALTARLGYKSKGGSDIRVRRILADLGYEAPVGRPGKPKRYLRAPGHGCFGPYLHIHEGAKP